MRRGALALAASLLMLAGCGSDDAPDFSASGSTAVLDEACLSADDAVRGVVLTRSDGVTLPGLFVGSGDVGVVYASQAGSTMCNWYADATAWGEQGFRGLIFSYSGETDTDHDVLAAVAAMEQQDVDKVFVVGASKGGTSGLTAMSNDPADVSGVVSLSGPAEWEGVDALAAVPSLTIPVLYVAGDADQPFADDAQSMYDATGTTDKRLEYVATSAHGVDLLQRDDVLTLVQDWRGRAGDPQRSVRAAAPRPLACKLRNTEPFPRMRESASVGRAGQRRHRRTPASFRSRAPLGTPKDRAGRPGLGLRATEKPSRCSRRSAQGRDAASAAISSRRSPVAPMCWSVRRASWFARRRTSRSRS